MANKKRGKKIAPARIIVLILIFAALFLSFRFDAYLLQFATSLQKPWLNPVMLWITYLGSGISVLLISTFLFLCRKRKWLLPLWASLFFSLALTTIIKILSARVRPFYLGFPTLITLVQRGMGSSFPSSHAAAAFAVLPLLDKEFPKLRFVWLAFACLVAFSRVYFALHYASDVIFGAVIGYGIGFIAVKLEEKYKYSNVVNAIRKIITKEV